MLLTSMDHEVYAEDYQNVREKTLESLVTVKLPYLLWASYLWTSFDKETSIKFNTVAKTATVLP